MRCFLSHNIGIYMITKNFDVKAWIKLSILVKSILVKCLVKCLTMISDDDMNSKRSIMRQLNLPFFFSIVIHITRTEFIFS